MSEPQSVSLAAQVASDEQPALIAGANMLSVRLGEAAGSAPWRVMLNFVAPGAAFPASPAADAVILSLLPEAEGQDSLSEVEARWRDGLSLLNETGASVLICTVFHRLAGRSGAGRPGPLLERIRRLNLMAAVLSHELGVGVIDLDRALTHFGGRDLATDHRLGGPLAAEVAGHAVAWSLLSFGLDAAVEPEVQEAAKALLGDVTALEARLSGRLGAPALG